MRALRRAELCRVALSDVLGHADLGAVGVALSDLASATVDAGLQLARREIDAPPIGVIALGRWGGSEMSYSSDADCMFVVPDDAEGEDLARATELVRRAAALIGKPGPDPALRSLTWDQGVEMAAHHRFTDETSCTVYFCDPHSPWQRPTNENSNGLKRQYFPKGTDFTRVTDAEVAAAEYELNTRPRKGLDYQTPAEKLAKLVGVAPTD